MVQMHALTEICITWKIYKLEYIYKFSHNCRVLFCQNVLHQKSSYSASVLKTFKVKTTKSQMNYIFLLLVDTQMRYEIFICLPTIISNQHPSKFTEWFHKHFSPFTEIIANYFNRNVFVTENANITKNNIIDKGIFLWYVTSYCL